MSNLTRRGRLAISLPDLHRLLGLPRDVQITTIEQVGGLNAVAINVVGEGLPYVEDFTEARIVPIRAKHDVAVADRVYADYSRLDLRHGPNTFTEASK